MVNTKAEGINQSNLFLDYLISDKNNQEKKIDFNQKFLLQKLGNLIVSTFPHPHLINNKFKDEKILNNNLDLKNNNLNLNNNNLNLDNNNLNKLIDKKHLIIDNLLNFKKSDNLNSIYKKYADKNKYNNLLNLLKILPNNLFSYKLLIENYIDKEINSYKPTNKLENFILLFKGKSPIDSIYNSKSLNSKKINTSKRSLEYFRSIEPALTKEGAIATEAAIAKRTVGSVGYSTVESIGTARAERYGREYIKSLTIFNSKNAYYFSNNYNYKFFANNNIIPKNIYTFLEYSFLSLSYLISKPIFEFSSNKVIIYLFYYHIKPRKKIIRYRNRYNGLLIKKIIYLKNNVSILRNKINKIKLQIISKILRQFFKKAIELEIVRLYYPFYNTNIFVNLLGKMVNKIKLRRILRRFFKKANKKIFNPTKIIGKKISKLPSFLAGVKIRVAGRLLTQRIIPRKTVKTISKGSLARGKVIFLEKSRFTNKNKRGAFSITVTTGHIT
jgi:hypothetical protein